MTSGQITIHAVRPHGIPLELAAACLTDDEKSRAARFRFPKDATHWTACRAALRQILGREIELPAHDVPLVFSEFGKPTLAAPFDSLHFNLSHCPDLALVAVGIDGPVGVDLEALERASQLPECENSFCHPEEILTLPTEINLRASALLRIWTAKEAVLKALGTGLSHPPEQVRITFGPSDAMAKSDTPLAGIENQSIQMLEDSAYAGYRVACSGPALLKRVEIVRRTFFWEVD